MDTGVIVQSMKELIFAVNQNYEIIYASARISVITGKDSSETIGSICYKELIGRSTPCRGCPVAKFEKETNLTHDIITNFGERQFYSAAITSPSEGVFVEALTDVTEIYKECERFKHQIKEMKAKYVTSQLQGGHLKGDYEFLDNVLNAMSYGLMVADREYNIVKLNKIMRNRVNKKELTKCYQLYDRTEPCHDCPFDAHGVKRSSRVMGEYNYTVNMEPYQDLIVESIRDSTKEIKLISEISRSQEEVKEKQRQMELMNRELQKMNNEIKLAHKRINEELQQVGELQRSLLPESLPTATEYDFGAFYTPMEQSGGDYYDCIPMSNNFWGLAVADVSGHGTPAAVIMAMTVALMRSYTHDMLSSSSALAMVNEILCANIHTRDFVTMFYAVLDTENARLNFASAGHNPALLFDKSDMMVRTLTANGMFLGAFEDIEFEEKQVTMDEGDILFMYTDGLTEAMSPEREQYGLDKVISYIMMYNESPCNEIISEIMADVREFTANQPFEDDVTILMVKKLVKN